MNVLSLFDGISCGMVALERAGFKISKYHAYEIEQCAIDISENNYPRIKHCGDVYDANFKRYKGFDIVIGGSPCTYWSIARQGRETTSSGLGFDLFMQYVRAVEDSQCDYFIYENNYGIHEDIINEITKYLGVEPIMIDSAYVSAQSRRRLYWTNIPVSDMPVDKRLYVKDILVKHTNERDYSDLFYHYNHNPEEKSGLFKVREKHISFSDEQKFAPIRLGAISDENVKSNSQGYRVYSIEGKSVTIIASDKTEYYRIPRRGGHLIRKLTAVECERLQTLPDGYTRGFSRGQRIQCIGNGWTVDVIAHILSYL